MSWVLSEAGWLAIPRKRYSIRLCIGDLQTINEIGGMEAGNNVLHAFTEFALFCGAKRYDFAHLHGAWYAAQYDNAVMLSYLVRQLSMAEPGRNAPRESLRLNENEPRDVHLKFGLDEARTADDIESILSRFQRGMDAIKTDIWRETVEKMLKDSPLLVRSLQATARRHKEQGPLDQLARPLKLRERIRLAISPLTALFSKKSQI